MLLKDKSVVVTGGTGSLGKVLVRRLLTGEMGLPRQVTVFSRDEAKQHQMRLAFQRKRTATDEVIYHNFEQLRPPVQVPGVGRRGLGVVALPAGEDAVGAQVYEPRARRARELREAVREERVDLDARERVFGRRVLLDYADAVDDRVGSRRGEGARDRVEVLRRDAAYRARRVEQPRVRVSARVAAKGHVSVKARRESLPEFMPQHP